MSVYANFINFLFVVLKNLVFIYHSILRTIVLVVIIARPEKVVPLVFWDKKCFIHWELNEIPSNANDIG